MDIEQRYLFAAHTVLATIFLLLPPGCACYPPPSWDRPGSTERCANSLYKKELKLVLEDALERRSLDRLQGWFRRATQEGRLKYTPYISRSVIREGNDKISDVVNDLLPELLDDNIDRILAISNLEDRVATMANWHRSIPRRYAEYKDHPAFTKWEDRFFVIRMNDLDTILKKHIDEINTANRPQLLTLKNRWIRLPMDKSSDLQAAISYRMDYLVQKENQEYRDRLVATGIAIVGGALVLDAILDDGLGDCEPCGGDGQVIIYVGTAEIRTTSNCKRCGGDGWL